MAKRNNGNGNGTNAATATATAPDTVRGVDTIGPDLAGIVADLVTRTTGDTVTIGDLRRFAGPTAGPTGASVKFDATGAYDPRLTHGHRVGNAGIGRTIDALHSAGIIVGGSVIEPDPDAESGTNAVRVASNIGPESTLIFDRAASLALLSALGGPTYYDRRANFTPHNKPGRFAIAPSEPAPLPTK